MPTTDERVARKPRPCGSYPCHNTIEPGQTYRRHVGFPGDDGVSGETPWVIDECPDCAERSDVGSFAYIQHRYKVPAAKDVRAVADGRPGVITGTATGARLLVRLDGARRSMPWHPTWRIQYLAQESASANAEAHPSTAENEDARERRNPVAS